MAKQGKRRLLRLLKVSISAVFLAGSEARNMLARMFGVKRAFTCVVLYYHEVRPEHRSRFARQMDILLRHAKSARADWNSHSTANGRHAVVTFDDGYENVIENALPELEARGIPSTLFIVAEALGSYPPWLGTPAGCSKLMSIVRLQQSAGSNLVTIGSHTLTHPRLTRLREEDARREIVESRRKLETMLETEITLFSFPHGAFNGSLVNCCREAGYKRVFTISPATAFSDPQEFVTGRVSVEPTDWALEFQLKLLGAYNWMRYASALKRAVRSRLSIPSRGKSQPVAREIPS